MSTPDPLAAVRREYTLAGLDEADLAPTWHEQLRAWLGEADRPGIYDATAMVLATGGPRPAARTVLLKGLGEDGLVFHTNYASRKGRDLDADPRATALFPWYELQRQVIVEGTTSRLPPEASDAYWDSRPRGSQLSAAASPQSQVVGSRAELEDRVAEIDARHAGEPIPRPAHWGGFLLAPERVEFWQGRADRLHDRLAFRREGEAWVVERLAP